MFGATSLVGSHFVGTTPRSVAAAGRVDPRGQGTMVDRFDRVDLSQPHQVEAYVRSTTEPVIMNFAARTDVDGIEKERPASGTSEGGPAWTVNALSPVAIARASQSTGRYFIQVSTDFIFDGRAGPYGEEAARSPLSPDLSWYGWTKSEGERRLQEVAPHAAILRIAYPYRASFPNKLDFARKMVERQKRHDSPSYFSDQTITPTWIPDATRALGHLIKTRLSGVFHVASPEVTTPFQFAQELLKGLGDDPEQLREGSMREFLERKDATPRPLRGGLTCRRILAEGVPLTPWREGIRQFLSEGRSR